MSKPSSFEQKHIYEDKGAVCQKVCHPTSLYFLCCFALLMELWKGFFLFPARCYPTPHRDIRCQKWDHISCFFFGQSPRNSNSLLSIFERPFHRIGLKAILFYTSVQVRRNALQMLKSLAIADLPLLLQGILLWCGIDFDSPNSPQVTVLKSARSCASQALMSRGKAKPSIRLLLYYLIIHYHELICGLME